MSSFPNKVVFPKHFILLLSLMFGEMCLFTLWAICQKNVMEKDCIREHLQ